MKHLILSALCLLSIFSGTFAMDDNDDWQFSGTHTPKFQEDKDVELQEQSHLLKQDKEESYCSIKKVFTAGFYALLLGGCVSDLATIGQSVHDNRTMLPLPYNATLPANNQTCHYRYEWSCNYGLIVDKKECQKYCNKAHKKQHQNCYILQECGKNNHDPQLDSGIGSLVTRIFTLLVKLGYDLSCRE